MSRGGQAALSIAWVGITALLGLYVQRNLVVSGDLRLFMPKPATAVERLLLQEVGESPASRLLLVSLQGASPQVLAASSQAFALALRADPLFKAVANGADSVAAVPDKLLPYRYLLSTTLDSARFDTDFLRAQLEERLQDLSSPMAGVLEPWIARDPTLEFLKLAEQWQPAHQAQRRYDVWFDRRGTSALLMVATQAAAFDPDGQEIAAAALREHFAATRAAPRVTLTVSGPGAFSMMMKHRTQDQIAWLGTVDSLSMVLLLIVAYRSLRIVLLAALPLASAGVAGLAVVSALFGQVHGITLAFGFTLLGVAQDYPIHLLSHRRAGASALATARSVWPTLATGVISTCIAYLAFLCSGVIGLEQLACFTIVGLAVAGLTTRYLMPRLVPAKERDYGESAWLGRLWSRIIALPRPGWLAVAVALGCVTVLISGHAPLWQNDLGQLTPIPKNLTDQDERLREELGAADIRRLLVVDGGSADEVVAATEALSPKLDALVRRGDIASYESVARYLPSAGVQLRRQAALPDARTLEASLAAAVAGLPFKADLFVPFLEDVARARALPPLTGQMLTATPLQLRIDSLLLHRVRHWTGLITLSGVRDIPALEELAAQSGGVLTLLDLKQASEDLVAHQRVRILWSLAIAALLLLVTIGLALRSVRRMLRVVAPMALTTLIILATLHAARAPMNLFHLIALVLAAGLGVDYALFFEAVEEDPAEQRRTLHAVLVCSVSTFMVFGFLALSTLPVLRAIGVTVSLGVLANFAWALLLTRRPAHA